MGRANQKVIDFSAKKKSYEFGSGSKFLEHHPKNAFAGLHAMKMWFDIYYHCLSDENARDQNFQLWDILQGKNDAILNPFHTNWEHPNAILNI